MRHRAAGIAAASVLAVVAFAGCEETSDEKGKGETTDRVRTTRVQVVEGLGKDGRFDPGEIFKREGPGVVTVISVFDGTPPSILGGGGDEDSGGLGSGFVISPKGEVVTNAHVVTQGEGRLTRAKEVFVRFADGNQVEAEILGADPNFDVALLRIKPAGLTLTPLPLGNSDDVAVGAPVAAIGSPFGEERSLSVGVVSATDRTIDSLTNFSISGAIQTDAAINQGNSGGPLVDQAGKVIGINSQIRSSGGGSVGVGFAVPVDIVKRVIEQIRDDGEADFAYIGVSTVPVYPQLADRFDLGTDKGAWIQELSPRSPAADAGLKAGGKEQKFQARPYNIGGDVITKFGDTVIVEDSDLSEAIALRKPGEKVEMEILRDGRKRTVTIELEERPASRSRRSLLP